ncbi:MAG TPA: LacI family DNA-binding transcriptional regulator [Pseudolabrys sp.]|nr:LacI family DNA-binding transcriptional regulator [Pseudolabrys sp.]
MAGDARRQPTQLDIARMAGVSTATVSRVLNGSPLVKPELRERVEAVMTQRGYFPHAAARALASNRTYTIGAVIPTLNNAIFAASINAFERELQAADYTLLVAVSNYDLDMEAVQVRRLLERGVEGLLLIGNDHRDAVYKMLRRAGVVSVNTWAFDPQQRQPNIGFSNRDAAFALVDHLLALGHRRIGMIAGIADGNDRARDRLDAVRERLGRHGLALEPKSTMEIPYSIAEARAALARLAEQNALPTALICGNDVIALGVLFEALERGIAVPGRLSITGFDNLPLTEHIRPAITTIVVPAQEMGDAAALAILAAIESGKRIRSRELSAPLLVRETTGPPARV